MVPFVMVHLLRVNRPDYTPPATARRGDLRRGGVLAGELALGPLVPAARVVEIALENVHDAVDPRGEGRLLLLDDLVRRLPVAGRQELHRLSQRLAHVVLTLLRCGPRGSGPTRGRECPRTTPPPTAAALR